MDKEKMLADAMDWFDNTVRGEFRENVEHLLLSGAIGPETSSFVVCRAALLCCFIRSIWLSINLGLSACTAARL